MFVMNSGFRDAINERINFIKTLANKTYGRMMSC